MSKSTVALGLLGTNLDKASSRGDRWASWRPTVAICQQEDLVIDRFELIYDSRSASLMQTVLADIARVSPETEVRPHELRFNDPWDFGEVYSVLYEFARQQTFDLDHEDYLVHITTGTHVAQICLFLLTETRHLPGRLLQSSPPRRAAHVASGSYRIIDLDLSRYDQLATRFLEEQQESVAFLKAGIATRSRSFNALIDRIEQVALLTKAPILLTGPTGAGKSQLAGRIYQLKRNRQQISGSLVDVNCATLRGEQAMSTLFGHIRGAFTGASADRAGLLKAADGGVLFLDEIGELGLDEQAMLLRAIEEKVFTPVGSDVASTSNFQLIGGTNRDLSKEVAAGRFREDLLARINLWSFELPCLASRREDIDPNLDFELQRYAEAEGRKVTMNAEARRHFLEFAMHAASSWRGNFRDLNAAVTRMATLAPAGRINVAIVQEEIQRLQAAWNPPGATASPDDEVLAGVLSQTQVASLDRFDRVQLAEVVRVCQRSGSLSEAGRELFQASRLLKQKPNDADRLRKYLAKFGIQWTDLA